MLDKIKKMLKLTPKASSPVSPNDGSLKIGVGIADNKLVIKLDRFVDTVTFTKEQLSQFLAAVAGQMGQLK